MIDYVIPVVLGSSAIGFALMAWRSHNKPIVNGRVQAMRRLMELTHDGNQKQSRASDDIRAIGSQNL